jgi:hypothetical protein
MAEGEFTARYQARHIELNLGNVFAIGMLSLLWYGVAAWTSNYLSNTTIPVLSQLAIGAQTYLHAA